MEINIISLYPKIFSLHRVPVWITLTECTKGWKYARPCYSKVPASGHACLPISSTNSDTIVIKISWKNRYAGFLTRDIREASALAVHTETIMAAGCIRGAKSEKDGRKSVQITQKRGCVFYIVAEIKSPLTDGGKYGQQSSKADATSKNIPFPWSIHYFDTEPSYPLVWKWIS